MLIFGWIVYLVVRGFLNRHTTEILIGVAVFLLYSGALLGVLPGQPGVSWQGHLFGAIGGFLAARLLTTRTGTSSTALRDLSPYPTRRIRVRRRQVSELLMTVPTAQARGLETSGPRAAPSPESGDFRVKSPPMGTGRHGKQHVRSVGEAASSS